ncbi:unnamed protein product [Didymodactylos carnosus]|uniref:Uncharacterized protein n=1 Tax=Didymodactylos carnosus TaxID=1234261 RepID=A0A814N558_9BILA|nr:unnamed protein product [Didymodactylos carnosus]CAF3853007.1 unnamed protein product [Didymodactylos carnosus]
MAQIEKSEYVDAVGRIVTLIAQRSITPWCWPDFLFKMFPIGREHEKLLKILHDYTRKVRVAEKEVCEISVIFFPHRSLMFEQQNLKKKQLSAKRMAFLDTLLTKMHEEQLSRDDIQEEVDTFMFEVCQRFALVEEKVLLSTLLRKFVLTTT